MLNNELIAEFMGWNKDNQKTIPLGLREYDTLEDYWFHSSWDWLMPVVEKIENSHESCDIAFAPVGCIISRDGFNYNCDCDTKLEAVYKAVVEFIKWYNENK